MMYKRNRSASTGRKKSCSSCLSCLKIDMMHKRNKSTNTGRKTFLFLLSLLSKNRHDAQEEQEHKHRSQNFPVPPVSPV